MDMSKRRVCEGANEIKVNGIKYKKKILIRLKEIRE